MTVEQIVKLLPYDKPFLFVDRLLSVDQDSCSGTFKFRRDMAFYNGHFKNAPVTPGVLLTECCAQIGVVSLGIYLLSEQSLSVPTNFTMGMSSVQMEFLLPVFPGEMVRVVSQKVYYRFNKLKCRVKMFNAAEKLVCRGEIAGMIKPIANE